MSSRITLVFSLIVTFPALIILLFRYRLLVLSEITLWSCLMVRFLAWVHLSLIYSLLVWSEITLWTLKLQVFIFPALVLCSFMNSSLMSREVGDQAVFHYPFQHWYQHLLQQFSLQLHGQLSQLLQLAVFCVLQRCIKYIESLQCLYFQFIFCNVIRTGRMGTMKRLYKTQNT